MMLTIAACENDSGPAARTLTHPSTLQVTAPEGLTVASDDDGFWFLDAASHRTPLGVSIKLVSEEPALVAQAPWWQPLGHPSHTEIIPGGGSGGTMYRFSSAKPCGEKQWILVRATRQDEFGPPSFRTAEELLKSAHSPACER